MKNRVELLLDILFDKTAREDEREDAAMYLFDYDELRVVDAFFKIGKNSEEPHFLLEVSGEGIGEIWSRNNIFNLEKLKTLTDVSYSVAIAIIKLKNPDLLKKSGVVN